MYTQEINALIAAANDARHCLSAVNDETLRGSIDRTISSLEQTIANLQKCYEPVATPKLPDMNWVKGLPRPVSTKDAFMVDREMEVRVPEWMR